MTPLWDAVLRTRAENSINWMLPQDREDCNRIITNDLCNNPRPEDNSARRYASYYPNQPGLPQSAWITPISLDYPNQPGTIECSIGRWYFRYRILNANTIEVFSIGPSGENPNHPMYRPLER